MRLQAGIYPSRMRRVIGHEAVVRARVYLHRQAFAVRAQEHHELGSTRRVHMRLEHGRRVAEDRLTDG